MLIEHDIGSGDEVRAFGVTTIAGLIAVRQADSAVFEVADLAQAEGQPFAAIGLLEPATGQGQGQLVGVALTIRTAEAIGAEQRVVAKGQLVGIE